MSRNKDSLFRGSRLKARRKELGFSLDELGKACKSSKSYIWELENKPELEPSASKVFMMAHALGVSMEWLCGGKKRGDDYAALIGAKVLKAMGSKP